MKLAYNDITIRTVSLGDLWDDNLRCALWRRLFTRKSILYVAEFRGAVLGYDFALTPDYWIAQLQSLLNVSISDDHHKFGYGCVGDKVKLHIIFNVKE